MKVASSSPVIPSRADGEGPHICNWTLLGNSDGHNVFAGSLSVLRRIGMTAVRGNHSNAYDR